jgi:hypothetical protein
VWSRSHRCGQNDTLDTETPLAYIVGMEPNIKEFPEYFALCEISSFHGRNEDEWFILEWWGKAIGWAVYETTHSSIYSCDSGPA